MSQPNLRLVRGDTNKLNLVVRRPQIDVTTGVQLKDVNGNLLFSPVNLTGAAMLFTARNASNAIVLALDSDAPSATGDITFTSPVSGQAVATLTPVATASFSAPLWLSYDFQLVEADGTRTTVAKGSIVISADVTVP